MNYGHMILLGLSLVVGSGVVLVTSWIVLECFKKSARVGVERTWFRCLATCFYVGLAILLAAAVGRIIQNIVWEFKRCF